MVHGVGQVVESWMDMSKIVAGSQDKKSPYESLASSIGTGLVCLSVEARQRCVFETAKMKRQGLPGEGRVTQLFLPVSKGS
eukprot:483524-Pelagomonas_calceolata.AAC.1